MASRDATHFLGGRRSVVLTSKGLSLTTIPSVSLSLGPPAIEDEPMETTRSVRLISMCLTRPVVYLVRADWLPKHRFNTWLRVEPVSLPNSDEMEVRNLNVLSGRSDLMHQQIFVTGGILNAALKPPIPAHDEGETWRRMHLKSWSHPGDIRDRIRCHGRARENKGSSTSGEWTNSARKHRDRQAAQGVGEVGPHQQKKGGVIWRVIIQTRMYISSSDSPQKAQVSAREACREGRSSSSTTTHPVLDQSALRDW